MSDMSAAIGLASVSSGLPPPNSSACGLRDERPGHRLDHAARGERALGRAGADLDRSSGRACAALSPRSSGVDGTRSTPTMRTTSSTRSALPSMSGPPGRHRDLHASVLPGDDEAEPVQDPPRLPAAARRGRSAASPRTAGSRSRSRRLRPRRRPRSRSACRRRARAPSASPAPAPAA